MTSTFEISLYPLNNEYPASVVRFLQKLKGIQGIEINTNGMSTILIGDFGKIWAELAPLVEEQFLTEESIFVFKVAAGRREYVE